ncbi:hypothetical protein [Stutzerimonas nitrititolerans]|uniref:hypothetical protein n=1 Tax=Stutzerimonas nitrititolerans TaxID=2482751 RepID=UPI0028ABE532|nr:hypothetical protein [Stutzerimonas nitrititolerans]
MSDKTGGPAFPNEGGHKFVSGNEIRKTLPSSGMDLRDYFAAKAMQGLLTGGGDFEKFSHLAADAYAIADAMLVARAK